MRLSGLQGKARHSGSRGYAEIAAMHRFMCMPLAQFEQQSMRIPVFHGATVLLVIPESQRGQLACDCELFLTVVPFCSTCKTI